MIAGTYAGLRGGEAPARMPLILRGGKVELCLMDRASLVPRDLTAEIVFDALASLGQGKRNFVVYNLCFDLVRKV